MLAFITAPLHLTTLGYLLNAGHLGIFLTKWAAHGLSFLDFGLQRTRANYRSCAHTLPRLKQHKKDACLMFIVDVVGVVLMLMDVLM